MPLSQEEIVRRKDVGTFQENVARSIIEKQTAPLLLMTKEGRAAHIRRVVEKVNEKSEDELITFMSSRQPGVDPKLAKALEETELAQTRGQAGLLEEDEGGNLEELEHEAELQSLGVDTNRPLPAGDLERGFGVEAVQSLTNALSRHFEKRVTVFRRGEDILYIDPTDQAVVLAKKGPKSIVGETLPLGGDVAGTVAGGLGGAALTKTPAGAVAGETLGSGVGTATGELIRLNVGKALGVHDLSREEMLERAAILGGEAAIVTGVTGGTIAGAKNIRNFVKGRVFTKAEALKHGMSTEEADVVIDEVNKILGGKGEIKSTLFQKTDDVVIGAKEAEVRQNIKHARDFTKRDIADQKALAEATDITTKPSAAEGGKAVQDVVGKQVGKRVEQAKTVVAKNAKELGEQLSKISKSPKETVGRPTRQIIAKKAKMAKDAVDAKWAEVRQSGGFDEKTETFGIKIERGSEVARRDKILKQRAKEAATQTEAKGTSIFTEKPKAQDLENFNRELSGLRKKKRSLDKGAQFTDLQAKELNDVIGAMEKDRRLQLVKQGRGDLLKKIEAAEEETAKFHAKFNRSIIGDLTAKNEKGVFKIKDKDFVDSTLKGSDEEADQLLAVIGDRPTLISKWKRGIADAHKRDVIDKLGVFKGGKLSREQQKELVDKTTDWIKQREGVLNKFLSAEEKAALKETGGLAVLVKKQTAQRNQIIKDSAKFGKGKLASLDPDNLVKFVSGRSGSFVTPVGRGIQAPLSKIKFVKKATKNHPAAWESFKSEFSTSIRKSIIDPETGFVNPKKISDLVNNQADEVAEIMGGQYLKDLRSINKVSQILKRKPKGLSGDEARAGIIQAFRSGVAPPLTRRGRAFTAVVIFDTKAAHDAIAKALLDPSSMSDVAKLAEHSTITREAAELAISLGFIKDNEEQ